MNSGTYASAAEARTALKAAIAADPRWPALRAKLGQTTGPMSMPRLAQVAERLGIDAEEYRRGKPRHGVAPAAPPTATISVTAPPAEPTEPEPTEPEPTEPEPEWVEDDAGAFEDPEGETASETETETAPVSAVDLDSILGPFAGSPIETAIREAIETARAEGHADGVASVPPAPVPVADGSAPPDVFPARRLGTHPTAKLFDLPRRKALGNVESDRYAPGPYTPAIDPVFQWDHDTLADIEAARGPILVHGPRGTGKTTMVSQYAARTGRAYFRINFTRSTEPADLVGQPIPTSKGPVWRDGALSHAIRHEGAVILLDEPSIASPGAMAILHSVLEPNGRIDVHDDGGRTIRVAPGVVFVLADNTDLWGDESGLYSGAGAQNAALIDRCSVSIPIDYMSAASESGVLQAVTGAPAKLADHLVNVGTLSRAMTERGELSTPIGTRALLDWASLIVAGRPVLRAWGVTVLGKAPPDDRPALDQLYASQVSESVIARALAPASAEPAPADGTVPPATTAAGRAAQGEFGPV